MAGGALKYRHLGRKSSHRQALLRNLVTSLFKHESITTTWHKAKEAQRLAEKLITLGKKNTDASRKRAEGIFFSPLPHLQNLFTTLRTRYATRPGGYTRVLRIEPRNRNHDQAATAILELVDGPRDMRFAMTARTLVRERAAMSETTSNSSDDSSSSSALGLLMGSMAGKGGGKGGSGGKSGGNRGVGIRDITAKNVGKVTRFREGGMEALEREVRRLEIEGVGDRGGG